MLYLLGGRSLSLSRDVCNGCGRCEEVCPHGVFAIVDRRAIVVARDACMEYGACRMNCAVGAIRVESGVGCAQAVMNARRGTGVTCDQGCNCS